LQDIDSALEEIGFLLAAALDLDISACFEEILLMHALVDGVGDLDLAGDAVTFHAAGEVHGVAPKIIDKLLNANDAGDDLC
jgi:hypothetical protein